MNENKIGHTEIPLGIWQVLIVIFCLLRNPRDCQNLYATKYWGYEAP
jgi:hypothetical protein